LGKKWTCFSCGVKFYDLSRSDALCPKCGSNQKTAPAKAKAPKKGKAAIQIDDDYTGEHEQEAQEDGLEESFGLSQAKVEGVDPGDLAMDDYDE
jgi:uncharacterized protein (TIGR02300 family)